MRRIGVAMIATMLAAGAGAADYHTYQKAVFSEGTLEIGPYVQVDADCRSKGRVEIKALNGPSSGSIRFFQKSAAGKFIGDYAHCTGRPVLSSYVAYKPNRGFTGSDELRLDVVSPAGSELIETYEITVR
jgi:hypothetical protein